MNPFRYFLMAANISASFVLVYLGQEQLSLTFLAVAALLVLNFVFLFSNPMDPRKR